MRPAQFMATKKCFPMHQQQATMCPNRLYIEYSYRKGFAFFCCCCLVVLRGFVWVFFLLFLWVVFVCFFSLVCLLGDFCGAGFILMHQFSVPSFHFTQQRASGVANRVCKYKTTFSIGNYNRIVNVSFLFGSKSW